MALGAGQVLRHGHMGDLGCAFVGVVRTRKDTTPFKIEFRKECRSDSDHPHHPSKIQWFSSRAGSSPNGSIVGCRSEEHTSELQPLMRISYAVFCLKKKKYYTHRTFVNNQ